jgi:site-specific DNA-methyltransferase (adenine-specific)
VADHGEVFTPGWMVDAILDTLTDAWSADHDGANLWANSRMRFLDSCTKSGIFLREIKCNSM